MNEDDFDRIQQITAFAPLKLVGDSRRLAILRQLMAGPATLSQLSKRAGTYPAQIRHHVKLLEEAGLIELVFTRLSGGFVEKFYRATARAFIINLTILPQFSQEGAIITLGSHDLALESIARHMQEGEHHPGLVALPVGSLDGLIALRQGICQMAGCHLLDAPSGEYNSEHVRHLFPGEEMVLITLAHREQGLMVAPGNPHRIQGLEDLTREEITFANRRRGAGTRLWLDQQLGQLGVPGQQVKGYDLEMKTHTQVARAVASGQVDVGLGVVAAARPLHLDIIPLFEERYDLVIPAASLANPLLQPLLDYLQTADLRRTISQLDGYDATRTGEVRKV